MPNCPVSCLVLDGLPGHMLLSLSYLFIVSSLEEFLGLLSFVTLTLLEKTGQLLGRPSLVWGSPPNHLRLCTPGQKAQKGLCPLLAVCFMDAHVADLPHNW